jgi:hypothetical protein
MATLTKLDSKVAIYVPTTVDVNQWADTSKQVHNCLAFLASLFGGSTSSKAEGFWVSQEKGEVKEEITIVYAYCTKKALKQERERILNFCLNMKEILRQETIALELEKDFYLLG